MLCISIIIEVGVGLDWSGNLIFFIQQLTITVDKKKCFLIIEKSTFFRNQNQNQNCKFKRYVSCF